jgi:hypothetical protein
MKLQAFIATVIAVTAAAQTDNPLHPGLQNWPPSNHYRQRLQPHFREVESIAVQEENAEMEDMCAHPSMLYPVSPQELACVQYTIFKSVGVESLTAGQVVEVQYKAPDSGRVSVNLVAANDDIVLHTDSRIEWYSWTNTYLFNSRINGEWGPQQIVPGFPFTCGPVPTTINVQIAVLDEEFLVIVNGIILGTYTFRDSLTPDKVVRVECNIDDVTATYKGHVDGILVSF